ncbi:hypothetical protein GCM10022223_28680 [Kineosporia mesophila]|uniref:Tetratricopeptide repeat protein n=1 Tax=Kineosporia mesophila TaxID=566012 RepID=A0ABP6ZLH7_9ACTN|nr:hypothetical protein [Kineosporia mesophila]MCD5349711.1 hypothetical protein [Kineosporia mesophila]
MDRGLPEQIADLLSEIDSAPSGPAERVLIDAAIALADEYELDELGYAARLRLLASANRTGDTDAQLSAFAWCVGRHQADPQRFPLRVGEFDLLWFHKHVVGALMGSPLFSRADVNFAIEAMESAYRLAGVGLSALWQARFQAATGQGRLERAGELLADLRRTPRDAYSHCAACSRAEEAEFHYACGHDEAGLRLADEILTRDLVCASEPAGTLAGALLPMLRSGRLNDARRAHLRGYREARSNPDNLRMIAQHLRFCAVTGNEARGLEILEQHLRWLTHDGLNARGHLDVLSASGVLLAAAVRAGAGDQIVRTASAIGLVRLLGERETGWTVRDLTVTVRDRAARLAAQFDARNGNDFQTRLLARDLDLLNTYYDVPLATRSAPRVSAGAPVGGETELRTRAAHLKSEAERLASDEPVLALACAGEALEISLALGDRDQSVTTARLAALTATTLGENDAAVEYCRAAVREAAAGELPGESAFRLELGAALCRAGEADEGTVEIEEALALLRAAGAPAGELAEAYFLLGQALGAQSDGDGARDSYRDAVALASTAGDWAATTRYGLALGELLFARRDQDSLNVLAGVVESARQTRGNPLTLVRAEHLLGQALAQIAGVEQAEMVLREALREASDPFATLDPAVVHEHAEILDSLARTVGDAGPERVDEAVGLAREAASAFIAVQAAGQAGRSLLLAAHLLDGAARAAQALPLLLEAEPLLDDRPQLLLECLISLVSVYERLERPAAARAAAARVGRVRQDHFGDLQFIDDLG